MKTNSKEVRNAIKQHILDCVYDYEENNFKTLKDACNHLNNEFERVAGHEYNRRKFPNQVERFVDYLQGIPFHFEYTNEGISEYINGLGINPENKSYSSSKSWNLYGLLIYREMTKNL